MLLGNLHGDGSEPSKEGAAVFEGGLGLCTQVLKNCDGVVQIQSGSYAAVAGDEEDLPNLELLQETLKLLEDVQTVDIRMNSRVPRISRKELQSVTENLIFGGQFVLLEGEMAKDAEEWLQEVNYAVKREQCLIAIAHSEEELPDVNLMYALYAAYLDIPLENIARLTKKDDE